LQKKRLRNTFDIKGAGSNLKLGAQIPAPGAGKNLMCPNFFSKIVGQHQSRTFTQTNT